jgi:hypothetical protein
VVEYVLQRDRIDSGSVLGGVKAALEVGERYLRAVD